MMHLRVLTMLTLCCEGCVWSEPAPPPAPGVMVEFGGRRIHLDCRGTGTPTVVIAGGGFSVDWYLVQTDVARFARVCTYDPAGTAWSTSPPRNDPSGPSVVTCGGQVEELRQTLDHAAIPGPYVLVGFSIGGFYARLFANRFPQDVSGLVIVDHAFVPAENSSTARSQTARQPGPSTDSRLASQADTPPVLIESAPIEIGLEDDVNFSKLPEQIRALHQWAMSLHPARPNAAAVAECREAVENTRGKLASPLGNRPLIVISTDNTSPGYAELQAGLLGLSRNSVSRVAHGSSHMIIIDSPEVVVQAIRDVVTAVRNHSALKASQAGVKSNSRCRVLLN